MIQFRFFKRNTELLCGDFRPRRKRVRAGCPIATWKLDKGNLLQRGKMNFSYLIIKIKSHLQGACQVVPADIRKLDKD
jgi:hypothetical protein